MKIIVTLEIEVDPEDWYFVYGVARNPAAVRDDVKDYVYDAVYQLPGITESEATVKLR